MFYISFKYQSHLLSLDIILNIYQRGTFIDFPSILQGPFATFKLQQDKDCDWTGLKFSPDGKLILISTNGQVIRLIDAFQGTPLQTFMVNHIQLIVSLFNRYNSLLKETLTYCTESYELKNLLTR